ncbi:hypothetical protein RP20_CCG025866 [Aedes albopictus]|nr:hypothetical protein RP20_CCG025866 [Aedes albopictus]
MICSRANKRRDPKKILSPATDQTGSQVNFYYGAHTPYAESIAPSHHSTYAHYYDDEEDGWEMPNFYNESYMKEAGAACEEDDEDLEKEIDKDRIQLSASGNGGGGQIQPVRILTFLGGKSKQFHSPPHPFTHRLVAPTVCDPQETSKFESVICARRRHYRSRITG